MKYMLVSDSHDALTGMRLAGIEGVFVSGAHEAEREINRCIDDEEIGIVLVTERLAESCKELIDEVKLTKSRPLIVTIPRSKRSQVDDNIMRYVREAIGIKI